MFGKPPDMKFAVAYRSGGTHDCRWSSVTDLYPTHAAAQSVADEIEKAGRKALVYKATELDRVDLPVGWEPGAVNYDTDTILFGAYQTRHIKNGRI